MDRGAWWATVQGVAKSQTRLSDSHTLCTALYSCWGASSQIVQWREPESGQQEAQVGQCSAWSLLVAQAGHRPY